MECTVTGARLVARDVAAMTVRAPELAAACEPGQFAHIYCGGGVYSLTRRPISISKVEGDELGFLFQIKGEGTRWLAQRRPGETVNLMAPLGKGCYRLPGQGKVYIAAGGIGYAPVIFLAQRAAARGLDARMFVGARDSGSIYCLDEMEKLGVPVEVATEDGSLGERGFVTAPLERAIQADRPDLICCCGPEPMLRAVARLGRTYGVPVQVSLEQRMACGVGACKGCVVPVRGQQDGVHYRNVCSDGPVFCGEEVFFDAE